MSTMTADAKFWDDLAERYAAKPVENVPAYERKKAVMRELLGADDTVLDVGCGTGSLALELSPFLGHVHAMDVSSEMLRIANAKKDAQQASNVTFHQGTLDGPVPFSPGQFQGVFAMSLLHLLEDRAGALQTIYELLEPGGVLVSSNVCLGGTWVPYGALITVMRWFGKAPKVWCYDRAEILEDMRAAGFVDIVEREVGAAKRTAFLVARKPA